jgi:ADP-heptose:LPS heptosyltransferase
VRSLLLVRLRVGLGDLLCTVPAVRALRAARPDLHVALTSWPETAGVVARLAPWVDELVPFPGAPGIPERPPDGTLPDWSAAMAARGWDLALQVYGDNPAASAVTAGVGARLTGGFAPRALPDLDPALHLPYPHALHEVARHLRLFEHLGLPAGADPALELPLTDADEHAAAALGLPPGASPSSTRVPRPPAGAGRSSASPRSRTGSPPPASWSWSAGSRARRRSPARSSPPAAPPSST